MENGMENMEDLILKKIDEMNNLFLIVIEKKPT